MSLRMAGIHIGPSPALRTNPRRRSRSAWLRRTLLAAGRNVVIVLGQSTVFLALLALAAGALVGILLVAH